MCDKIKMRRVWAMPSEKTFSIPDIRALVKTYLAQSVVSIDPFARNKRWATYTNDLSPETGAEYHLDAYTFLVQLRDEGVQADTVLFDPPYSRNQVKSVYQSVGRHYGIEDSQDHSGNWRKERDVINEIIIPGGHVLSFGWNTSGMYKARGFEIVEILLVNHGGAHNDTICTVERKITTPQQFFAFQ